MWDLGIKAMTQFRNDNKHEIKDQICHLVSSGHTFTTEELCVKPEVFPAKKRISSMRFVPR